MKDIKNSPYVKTKPFTGYYSKFLTASISISVSNSHPFSLLSYNTLDIILNLHILVQNEIKNLNYKPVLEKHLQMWKTDKKQQTSTHYGTRKWNQIFDNRGNSILTFVL